MGFHFAFLLIYLVAGSFLDPTSMNWLFVVHCLIAVYVRSKVYKEIISPIIVFFVGGALVGYGNTQMISIIGTEGNKSYWYIVPEYLPQATMIWCIGSTLIFLGYHAGERFSFPKIRYDIPGEALQRMFGILLVLAFAIPYLSSTLKSLGSFAKLLSLAGMVGVVFFARLWSLTDNKRYATYTNILFAVQTINAFLFAYVRFALVAPTMAVVLGYLSGKSNVRQFLSKKMIPFFLAIGLFVASFSTLALYRDNFSSVVVDQIFSEDSQEDEEIVISDEGEDAEETKSSFIIRLSCITQLTNIVKLVEKNGFYDGFASAPLLTALIPRFLWPDKPNIELGLWFALEIGAAYKAEGKRGNNSVNMTPMGQFYLDFGWSGVVLGCLLFGVFNVMLWNSIDYMKTRFNLLGAILGAYLLVFSFYAPTLDLQLVITYTSYYLILLFVNRIVLRGTALKWKTSKLSR
jgi:hypothetical protein